MAKDDDFTGGFSPRAAAAMLKYRAPQGHDKHLSDTERAHSGAPGSKVRHGADAAGVVKAPKMTQGEPVDSGKKFGNV